MMGFIFAVFFVIVIVTAVAFGATIFLAARTVREKNRDNASLGGFQGDPPFPSHGSVRPIGLPPTAMDAEQMALWQNTINTNAAIDQPDVSHHDATPAAETIHHHDTTHHQPQPAPEVPHDVHHATTTYQPPSPMPDIPAPTFDAGMHHGGHGM